MDKLKFILLWNLTLILALHVLHCVRLVVMGVATPTMLSFIVIPMVIAVVIYVTSKINFMGCLYNRYVFIPAMILSIVSFMVFTKTMVQFFKISGMELKPMSLKAEVEYFHPEPEGVTIVASPAEYASIMDEKSEIIYAVLKESGYSNPEFHKLVIAQAALETGCNLPTGCASWVEKKNNLFALSGSKGVLSYTSFESNVKKYVQIIQRKGITPQEVNEMDKGKLLSYFSERLAAKPAFHQTPDYDERLERRFNLMFK